jgi:hypothetical protein
MTVFPLGNVRIYKVFKYCVKPFSFFVNNDYYYEVLSDRKLVISEVFLNYLSKKYTDAFSL